MDYVTADNITYFTTLLTRFAEYNNFRYREPLGRSNGLVITIFNITVPLGDHEYTEGFTTSYITTAPPIFILVGFW